MKTSKYHIITSWILLIGFVAGQCVIYAHQHNNGVVTSKKNYTAQHPAKQSVKEKCNLCDAMHHTSMIAGESFSFYQAVVNKFVYKPYRYILFSARLVPSGGRAPPMLIL